jgi:hypothetical protein
MSVESPAWSPFALSPLAKPTRKMSDLNLGAAERMCSWSGISGDLGSTSAGSRHFPLRVLLFTRVAGVGLDVRRIACVVSLRAEPVGEADAQDE